MSEEERKKWPLFAVKKCSIRKRRVDDGTGGGNTVDLMDLSSRDGAFQSLAKIYFEKKKWPGWMLPMLYS